MTSDREDRKRHPIARGVLDYFPDAIAAVANVSLVGNEQHNPGEPLHWSRGKSDDHADCIVRHLIDRGNIDTDGVRHAAKVAWRALALLQLEIEAARAEEACVAVDEAAQTWRAQREQEDADEARLAAEAQAERDQAALDASEQAAMSGGTGTGVLGPRVYAGKCTLLDRNSGVSWTLSRYRKKF